MKLTLARCAQALVVAASFTPHLLGQDYFGPDDCDGYSPPVWRVRGEYLMWWTNGNRLPPLVTTSDVTMPNGQPTPMGQAGVLGARDAQGNPLTRLLFGGESIDTDVRSGARMTLSRWFGDTEETAIEFTGFYVDDDQETGDFVRMSLGNPILARPFFDIATNQQRADLVAFPGQLEGRIAVNSYSETYSGAALLRQNFGLAEYGRMDFLGGYRYFSFRENFSIRENREAIGPNAGIAIGTTEERLDRFNTRNEFHGAEFGLSAEIFYPIATVEAIAKVAVGNLYRQAQIRGETTVTAPGGAVSTEARGRLARFSNIGDYGLTDLSVLPELNLNANVPITQNASFIFGYSLIVLNDVFRTGNQIDTVFGQPLAPPGGQAPPRRPDFTFNTSHFILQGMNFGVEYLW